MSAIADSDGQRLEAIRHPAEILQHSEAPRRRVRSNGTPWTAVPDRSTFINSLKSQFNRVQIRLSSVPSDNRIHLSYVDATTTAELAEIPKKPHPMDMKGQAKKKGRAGGIKRKRAAASLGRSPVTGASVLKPVTRGASISLDDVRRVLRTMKPLALD
jgi:hypothetical protein